MSKPTTTNASHSANGSADQRAVIPAACPDWCADHSPFGDDPITEANPGGHQTGNLAAVAGQEVRVESWPGDGLSVNVTTMGGDIRLEDLEAVRDLGQALIKASVVLEVEVASPYVPLRGDLSMPELFDLAASIGITPSSLVAAHEAVMTR